MVLILPCSINICHLRIGDFIVCRLYIFRNYSDTIHSDTVLRWPRRMTFNFSYKVGDVYLVPHHPHKIAGSWKNQVKKWLGIGSNKKPTLKNITKFILLLDKSSCVHPKLDIPAEMLVMKWIRLDSLFLISLYICEQFSCL